MDDESADKEVSPLAWAWRRLNERNCLYCGESIDARAAMCPKCETERPFLPKDPNQIVRTYRGKPKQIQRQFKSEATRLTRDGYEVSSTSGIGGHRGGIGTGVGIVTLGAAFLLARPEDSLIVTYRKKQ